MDNYIVASKLLQKGIQCIPLNQTKKPLIAFKDLQITQQFIEDNKYSYQSPVLGVLTRGVWCIDIDVHDHDGFKSVEANCFADEIEANANNTMVQVTPSGGMHLIFKKREGVSYSQKIGYLEGVDIKANDNNYFVMGGSVTQNGIYTHNRKKPIEYNGEFEKRIFEASGSFKQQIESKYSVKTVLPNHDFSHLDFNGKGGRGKDAYQRIIEGESYERNNDLLLAASYAKQYRIDLEPLKVLIGDVKSGDEFTENEWIATVNSARSL